MELALLAPRTTLCLSIVSSRITTHKRLVHALPRQSFVAREEGLAVPFLQANSIATCAPLPS